MSDKRFTVVRLDLPLDAATFDTMVGADAEVTLHVCATHGQDQEAWQAFETAHAYHVSSARDDLPAQWCVGAPLIARCPRLLAVSTYGAGYDTVDVAACTALGVCVVNQAGSNADAVAEHTLGFILGLSKRIVECDRRLRRGERFFRHEAMGGDLDGCVLGLVGIGHVGRRVAALARAFGMRVIACDPLVAREEIVRRGAEPVALGDLLGSADVVSLHCPLDAGTRDMIDAAAFAAMKPGVLFISTARGCIHDEAALLRALVSGHVAGAGLDVWAVEPPPASHPLLALDNVMATYHTAGVTRGARRMMASMAASQILDIAHGMPPPRLVNPEVWPAYVRRHAQVRGRPPVSA